MRPGSCVLILAAALFVAAACGDSPPPSPDPSPGAGSATPIRGNERLGWDQPAANRAELESFRYAIYVDGTRTVMAGVTCGAAQTPAGFPCSGQLPPMSPGTHTLELAAFVEKDDTIVEGPKSPPFQVNVTPGLGAPAAGGPDGIDDDRPRRRPVAPLEADAVFETVAGGYTDIAAVTVTDDGWLIVAERDGLLRATQLADERSESVLAISGTRADGWAGGLVGVAADPDFARTKYLYLLQTAPARDGLTWQLVRYRQAGAAFGERAVLLQTGTAPPRARGAVRVGPDGLLYVALQDAEGRTRRFRDRDTAAMLVLRLNPDGTTPDDQPAANPVVAAVAGDALGFDWEPARGDLVVAAGTSDGPVRLRTLDSTLRQTGGRSARLDLVLSGARGVSGIGFYRGPLEGTGPSGAAVERSDGLAFLVAGTSGLHRAELDATDPSRLRSFEPLTDTPIRSIAVLPDGRAIVATAEQVLLVR